MFFYITFLRPPPREAVSFGTITTTLQISNDLRTEPFPEELDVYYGWLSEPLAGVPVSTPTPAKLTTWRITNLYKEITVPLPAQATVGQRWRLYLTTRSQNPSQSPLPYAVELGREDIGTSPFAVMSMPIGIVGSLPMSPSRQTQIQRIFQFSASETSSKSPAMYSMTIKEELSYDLDKKIWDSGVGLSSWLVDLCNGVLETGNSDAIKAVQNTFFSTEQRKIIELGTGSGIVSITLGALRALFNASHNGIILATDLPSAMPLLKDNISANRHLYHSVPPLAAVLDWDDENLSDTITQCGGYHAIIMSDISYNTSSFPALLRTITSLLHLQPSENPPLLLIGYKRRDPSERQLWQTMVKDLGITFQIIGKRKGAGGANVSIWVGRLLQHQIVSVLE